MSKNIYPIWLFKVKDGAIEFEDRQGFMRYLADNFGDDRVGEMVAKPHRKVRSSGQDWEGGDQNGYYWAVIVRMVAEEMGIFDHEAHDFLRGRFLIEGRTASNGYRYEVAKSTSDLNTGEFEDYCGKIRTWASMPGELCEYGLNIPLPNEASWN